MRSLPPMEKEVAGIYLTWSLRKICVGYHIDPKTKFLSDVSSGQHNGTHVKCPQIDFYLTYRLRASNQSQSVGIDLPFTKIKDLKRYCSGK